MTDLKDLISALVYAMIFKAAQQSSRKNSNSIRITSIQDPSFELTESSRSSRKMCKIPPRNFSCLQRKEKEKREKRELNNNKTKCWSCGKDTTSGDNAQHIKMKKKKLRLLSRKTRM